MTNPMESLWDRYQSYLVRNSVLGISLDVSRMRFSSAFFDEMDGAIREALDEMTALEGGGIANADEKRMVGHYWLRAPELAPTAEIRAEVETTRAQIAAFAAEVHERHQFSDLLVIGIGGSALGPQFVSDALGTAADAMRLHFLDNTDPDGIDRVLSALEPRLEHTLTIVISKSGGTKETRNGMIETRARYEKLGLDFARHVVAVTGRDSELDKIAASERWLRRFPMWDWVGGRTSVMSAVGLVPLSLQGLAVDEFLAGAAAMDDWTRLDVAQKNPAMLLALMWHYAGHGRGEKDMVVLPYKDRLLLFSRYLQQLVMESLGKELDRDGRRVNQGIAVYGNKGSTDQHAYVQQLRDGVPNFFVTFIEVRAGGGAVRVAVEPGITSNDYLQGFLRGTRSALYENGRESITVSIPEVSAFHVGALIALYERAVGFYGSLVNVNAYHQPGVEAGKKAATAVLDLQLRVRRALAEAPSGPHRATEMARTLRADVEPVYHVLTHLAANDPAVRATPGATPAEDQFSLA
jgi:glucose-6-phosphate isomerase